MKLAFLLEKKMCNSQGTPTTSQEGGKQKGAL